MALDYTALQNVAFNLLDQFGKNWTLRRIAKGVYSPVANTRSITSTTDHIVKAARLEYNQKQIDGEVIQKDDFKLIVEAKNLTITPTVHDKMVDGSDIYEIVNIKTVQPASTVVYYEMQVRQ